MSLRSERIDVRVNVGWRDGMETIDSGRRCLWGHSPISFLGPERSYQKWMIELA